MKLKNLLGKRKSNEPKESFAQTNKQTLLYRGEAVVNPEFDATIDSLNGQASQNYKRILDDIQRFRFKGYADGRNVSGCLSNSDKYDAPNYYFFKLFFYFDNQTDTGLESAGNLLSKSVDRKGLEGFYDSTVLDSLGCKGGISQTIKRTSESKATELQFANTALNYLLLNDELERARMLSQFINKLSEINTQSPWYFQELGGVDELLKREWFNPGTAGLDIKDERKVLTIKCLQDAIDDRIGTLMDLYRAACFSDVLKKEIVPANLRKFDMGIYIVSVPMKGINTSLSHGLDGEDGGVESLADNVRTYFGNSRKDSSVIDLQISCKYIECLNCEFDYNSMTSGYSNINNKDFGEGMNYEIKIHIDDVKEDRYNQFICMNIGDFVDIDLDPASEFNTKEEIIVPTTVPNFAENRTEKGWLKKTGDARRQLKNDSVLGSNMILNGYEGSPEEPKPDGFLSNSVRAIVKQGTNFIKSKVERLLLGNIFEPTVVNKVETGIDVLSSKDIVQAVNKAKTLKTKKTEKIGLLDNNIFDDGPNGGPQNSLSNAQVSNANIFAGGAASNDSYQIADPNFFDDPDQPVLKQQYMSLTKNIYTEL